MSITDLGVFRKHLRLSANSAEHDSIAQIYLDAAERAAADRIGVELGTGEGEQPINAAITAAILLIGGHLFENREAVVVGTGAVQLPLAVDALLAPYRRWLPEPGDA